MKIDRRKFTFAGGAFTLAFLVGGQISHLTPAQAKEQKIPLSGLNHQQIQLIDILGDAIVPGAKKAGLSHYIDHQLSTDEQDNLLIIKYLRVPAPFDGFYSAALLAFEAAIQDSFNKAPKDLTKNELITFITEMMQKNPKGWPQNAPPAPFFYFVLRSDAIDVTYGSLQAFDDLEIPYMAHIEPTHTWEVS